MTGCLLAVLTYFPLFHGLTHYANPALEAAHATAPAVVVSDPATCSIQFNPVGTAKFHHAVRPGQEHAGHLRGAIHQ